MHKDNKEYTSITVLLPAGRLGLDLMQRTLVLASRHKLEIYLTTQQNLRLLQVPISEKQDIMAELAACGVAFKAPGLFPIPRICVGAPHCNLGIIDTKELNQKISERFSDRKITKPKLKIAIAGCSLSCSGPRTSDIGIIAKKSGYEVYAGGKGGPNPVTGRRVGRALDENEVLETIENLITFHDGKTKKIQRMSNLVDHPDFPCQD